MIQTRWTQFYFLISSESVKVSVSQLCPTLCDSMDWLATRFFCPWNSPGENTGVGCHSLLQGIFPTWGLNPHLLRCRQILYHLSHQGSSKIKFYFVIIVPTCFFVVVISPDFLLYIQKKEEINLKTLEERRRGKRTWFSFRVNNIDSHLLK